MKKAPPYNPHVIVRIERPGNTSGTVVYDSWETKRLFKEVEVELVTNQSSEARITFFDPRFLIIDAFSDATAKAVVRVYLGYGKDLGEPVFKGILAQIERGDAETTLVIFDMAYVLKLVKRSGYKNKKGDIAIIKGLVERNKTPLGKSLKFEGPETPLKLEPQQNAMIGDQLTDWEWISERARDAGLIFYIRGDTLFAKYPVRTASGNPALTLTNRKDFTLLSGWDFTYRTPENQDGKPKIVRHRRRGRNGKFIKGESSEGTRGRDDTIIKRDMANPTKKKLTARAKAQKELDREHAYEGHVEIVMPTTGKRLDVRDTVAVWEIGKLFSGRYLCDSVRYRFAAGKLGLDLDLYRDVVEAGVGK